MILAITPNPSIDKCVVVNDFRLGRIHRPERVLNLAGGKGLNVAHTIRLLGGRVQACLILAGYNGRWMAEQLELERIPAAIIWTEGETRLSTSVVDPINHVLTEIYERGDPIRAEDWTRFLTALQSSLQTAAWATISGSLPCGAPLDGVAEIVKIAHSQHVPLIVDARDGFLSAALEAGPWCVKVNREEASRAAGIEIHSPQAAAEAAIILRNAGARNAVITLGEQGAVGLWESEIYWGHLPPLQTIAPVGSGDAFLGGLALSLSVSQPFTEALRTAIAAGAANALTLGAGMLEPSRVSELRDEVEIELLKGIDRG